MTEGLNWTDIYIYRQLASYNGILLSHKKWDNAICSNLGGPRDYHIEWSKSDKDKHDIAYMWNLKIKSQLNLFTNRNRVTGVEKKCMVTKEEMEGGINWKIDIEICTLLYIKHFTNLDLLYNTGNSSQYSVMTYMGKYFKKCNMYNWFTLLYNR